MSHTYRSSGTATAVLVPPPPPIPAMAACAHGEKPSIGTIRSIIDNSRVRTRGFHLDVVVATAVLVVDSNVRNDNDDEDVDDDEFHHFLDRIGLE